MGVSPLPEHNYAGALKGRNIQVRSACNEAVYHTAPSGLRKAGIFCDGLTPIVWTNCPFRVKIQSRYSHDFMPYSGAITSLRTAFYDFRFLMANSRSHLPQEKYLLRYSECKIFKMNILHSKPNQKSEILKLKSEIKNIRHSSIESFINQFSAVINLACRNTPLLFSTCN